MICLFNIAFLTYLWGMNGWLPSYLIKGKGIHLEHAGYLSSLPFIAMLLGEVLGAGCRTSWIGARWLASCRCAAPASVWRWCCTCRAPTA